MSTPGSDVLKKRLPDGVVEQIVKTQYQKALNESEDIKLKSRDIDHQAEYAKRLLQIQAEHLAKQPEEHRRTVTRYAYIVALLFLMILVFISVCLYFGKEDFVKFFLNIVSYIVVSVISFFVGRKSSEKKAEDSIKDTDVVA